MSRVTLAGQATQLHHFGHGKHPVMALHCSLAHGGAWRALGAELADAVTLTAPDLPDHGQSAASPAGAALHDTATAIAAALASQLDAGRPVDIIGHSFGGTIAVRLALEQPALVRRLVLLEPVLFSAAIAANAPEVAAWQTDYAGMDQLLDTGQQRIAAQRFHAEWGGLTAFDQLPRHQRDYIADRIWVIPALGDVIVRDRPGLMAPGRLEGLDIPVLLLAGAESPPIIVAINRALAARLPGAAPPATIPGASHMLPLTHAAAVAAHIRPFLGLPEPA